MNDKAVGRRVTAQRELAEMTQTELAVSAGLSVVTIQRIEKGVTSPRWRDLERIGKACGVDTRMRFVERS